MLIVRSELNEEATVLVTNREGVQSVAIESQGTDRVELIAEENCADCLYRVAKLENVSEVYAFFTLKVAVQISRFELSRFELIPVNDDEPLADVTLSECLEENCEDLFVVQSTEES